MSIVPITGFNIKIWVRKDAAHNSIVLLESLGYKNIKNFMGRINKEDYLCGTSGIIAYMSGLRDVPEFDLTYESLPTKEKVLKDLKLLYDNNKTKTDGLSKKVRTAFTAISSGQGCTGHSVQNRRIKTSIRIGHLSHAKIITG